MHIRMLLGVLRTYPFRWALTCLSLAAAFLLFGVLQGINSTLSASLGRLKADRILVTARYGVPLPRVHADQIARMPDVKAVTWTKFMYGLFGGDAKFFTVIYTDVDRFLTVRSEYKVAPEDLEVMRRTPAGVVVLDTMAKKYGLQKGQHVVLAGQPRKDGRNNWEVEIVGTISYPDNPSQVEFALGNFNSYDETRAMDVGTVDRIVVKVKDPTLAAPTGRAIDAAFLSSAAPTRTVAENAFGQSSFAVLGEIGRLSTWILSAVFGAMLILTANVVMQSVADRTAEFATLRALGYSRIHVTSIIFFEALVLCLVGAALGLVLAAHAYPQLSTWYIRLNVGVGDGPLPPSAFVAAFLCAVALAAISTLVPEFGINRVKPSVVLNSRA